MRHKTFSLPSGATVQIIHQDPSTDPEAQLPHSLMFVTTLADGSVSNTDRAYPRQAQAEAVYDAYDQPHAQAMIDGMMENGKVHQ